MWVCRVFSFHFSLCLRGSPTYLCIYFTVNGHLSCLHLWLSWDTATDLGAPASCCACASISWSNSKHGSAGSSTSLESDKLFPNTNIPTYLYTNNMCSRNLLFKCITGLQKFTVAAEILLEGNALSWMYSQQEVCLQNSLSESQQKWARGTANSGTKTTCKEQFIVQSLVLVRRHQVSTTCPSDNGRPARHVAGTENEEKIRWTAKGGKVGERRTDFILWSNLKLPTFQCSETQTTASGYSINRLDNQLYPRTFNFSQKWGYINSVGKHCSILLATIIICLTFKGGKFTLNLTSLNKVN